MFEALIDPRFMPHGHCFLWQPGILWTHVTADAVIALAYFSIPITLVYYLRRRRSLSEVNLRFAWVLLLFAGFIVLCGTTHLIGIWTMWTPAYQISGAVKAATALISIFTAAALIPIVPRALSMKSAEELEQTNAQLRAEMEQRMAAETHSEELEQAMSQLRETQALLVRSEQLASLGDMVSGIAHEVATPIGVGVTAASSLGDQAEVIARGVEEGTLTKQDLTDFLGVVRESSTLVLSNMKRASQIMTSFKTVSVDQSNNQRRRFLVHDYIEEILLNLRPKLKHTRHRINIEGDRTIELDSYPGVFSQILTNLVMNSLVHAWEPGTDGEIDISFARDEREFRLRYADNGAGMPDEVAARVFERFFTTKLGSGGSGIGMFLVRQFVVDQMGGEITVAGNPGRGAVFEIRLPLDGIRTLEPATGETRADPGVAPDAAPQMG